MATLLVFLGFLSAQEIGGRDQDDYSRGLVQSCRNEILSSLDYGVAGGAWAHRASGVVRPASVPMIEPPMPKTEIVGALIANSRALGSNRRKGIFVIINRLGGRRSRVGMGKNLLSHCHFKHQKVKSALRPQDGLAVRFMLSMLPM